MFNIKVMIKYCYKPPAWIISAVILSAPGDLQPFKFSITTSNSSFSYYCLINNSSHVVPFTAVFEHPNLLCSGKCVKFIVKKCCSLTSSLSSQHIFLSTPSPYNQKLPTYFEWKIKFHTHTYRGWKLLSFIIILIP